ncbi:transporter substrate-binding domain-containing protein [Pendulispora brunnea]|uniref:Transporter substrate-binding domain-containing protein n=1 Tax=Pendulispora brunnea TaxID=2905690 RepID=A0ABZ2K908_9BACT
MVPSRFFFMVAFVGVSSVLPACEGNHDAASPPSTGATTGRLQEIANRGELRVCSTGDYRPFTFYEAGTSTWSGIDVDMADDLARRLGVRRTMVHTTWKNLVQDFTSKCDIAVGGISITLERSKLAFFSDAYLDDGKVPITRCENESRFHTIEQINRPEVKVIVNPGGTNEQFVRAHLASANVIVHPDNNTIHHEIAAGRADLMITDSAEAQWQAKKNPELCAVNPQKPFTFSQKAYLLPLGDTAFQHYVNQWLNLTRHDGTYERIAKPWLG